MMRLTALLTIATVALSACGVPQVQVSPKGESSLPQQYNTGYSIAPPNAPSGPVVDNFARSFLDSIQARSIAERREYCGYFYIDPNGNLRGTPPRPGTFAGCEMPAPAPGLGIVASYHTHGAYGRVYDNEVPSVIDLASDFQFGIDGYVSTPGGRVWLVDFQTQSASQLCGLRCVTSDPGFAPQDEAGVRQSYTIPTLQRRFARN
ncbi:DUF4329 domain-containing protein [Octadecabacter ascidiaceicola]|uniref:DUF4329 domain-containing protein n=1 Tax=Octadecabacter ascidiaceicola TaxID=1655543 RepID=A0A238JMZ5_9RHOB|nr:DUF4329 domain-containing protein [Octadecabacter ascidiaceicola]SMX31584.1 hypothetical protein OCA8868_00435 [Octadecabacter ascidiaceicola]